MEYTYKVLEDAKARELVTLCLKRVGKIYSNCCIDPAKISKSRNPMTMIITECFVAGEPLYNVAEESFQRILEIIRELDHLKVRRVKIVLNDIWDYNHAELLEYGVDMDKIIDDYYDLKVKLDDVSPEVSDEVDRIVNMSDEEFEQSLEEDERKFNESIDKMEEEADAKAEESIEALKTEE